MDKLSVYANSPLNPALIAPPEEQFADTGVSPNDYIAAQWWNYYIQKSTIWRNYLVDYIERLRQELSTILLKTGQANLTDAIEIIRRILVASANEAGFILYYPHDSPPSGYLMCDGSQFDTERYPLLFDMLGSDRLPDFRECRLVGIGRNLTQVIASHDEFAVGEFKEFSIQTHAHDAEVATVDSVSSGPNFGWRITSPVVAPTEGTITDEGMPVQRGKSIGVNIIIKGL